MLLVVAGRWSSFCRCTGAEPGRALGGIPSRLALEALLLAVPGRLLPRLLPPLTEACADPGELLPKSSSRFTRVRATPSNPGAPAGAGCPCPPVSSACCQGRGGLPPEPAVDGRLAGADVGRDPAPGPKSCCGRDDASSGAGRGRRAPAVLGREPELLGGRSALAATFVRPPPTRSCRRPPMPAAHPRLDRCPCATSARPGQAAGCGYARRCRVANPGPPTSTAQPTSVVGCSPRTLASVVNLRHLRRRTTGGAGVATGSAAGTASDAETGAGGFLAGASAPRPSVLPGRGRARVTCCRASATPPKQPQIERRRRRRVWRERRGRQTTAICCQVRRGVNRRVLAGWRPGATLLAVVKSTADSAAARGPVDTANSSACGPAEAVISDMPAAVLCAPAGWRRQIR